MTSNLSRFRNQTAQKSRDFCYFHERCDFVSSLDSAYCICAVPCVQIEWILNRV